ncbi:MAG TPA: hypothetical protein VF043_01295 [Ktedonobacteraceae bacterium]
MNISPEEAQEALAAIQQTNVRTRKAYGYNGYYSIVWGLVWFFGFLASQYLQANVAGWIWGGLVLVGWVMSAALGINQGKYLRSVLGPRIAFFYLALFVFGAVWFVISRPQSIMQIILLLVTLIMFGGVAVGVFARTIPIIIGCVAITVLVLIGYYLLPAYFYLWVAISCGLSMFGTGLYVRLRWR